MSNFSLLMLFNVIVISSNLHHLKVLVSSNTYMVNMTSSTITYTREELLKFKDSTQRDNLFNWRHIDTIVHPTFHNAGRRIPTIISSRLPVSNHVDIPYQQKRYSNLLTIPTFQSIVDYKIDRAGSTSVNGRAGVA